MLRRDLTFRVECGIEPLEARRLSATVSGTLFVDLNGDGIRQSVDSGAGGVPVDVFNAVTNILAGADAIAFVQQAATGVPTGSLGDGIYRLTLDPTKVSADGVAMPAAPAPFTFHRLFGDANGNGSINNADFGAFRGAFGKASGNAGYSAAFDFDNSGSVNSLDYGQFRNRYGKSLTY